MSYKVKFINPANGKGFIEAYKTARRAKWVVEAYQAQFKKDGNKGIYAEYLGNSKKKAAPTIGPTLFCDLLCATGRRAGSRS